MSLYKINNTAINDKVNNLNHGLIFLKSSKAPKQNAAKGKIINKIFSSRDTSESIK